MPVKSSFVERDRMGFVGFPASGSVSGLQDVCQAAVNNLTGARQRS